ncbi:MAG: HAD family hydrolase [Anaerolineae bacterium]
MPLTSPSFRLVASDIDGTLVDDRGRLSPRTKRALRAVHDRGVGIALVTGLNPWVARRYGDEIGPWVRVICLNGIFTIEDGEIVPGRFIDADVARAAVSIILDEGYVPLVHGADQVTRYLPRHRERMGEVSALIAERPYQPYEPVERQGDLFVSPPAQVAVCDAPSHARALYEVLHRRLDGKAYVVHQPGGRTWVEVSHPRARKDSGLLTLARNLGIAPAEVLYFGDSLNDLPVFRRFPHAVAVANARPEIKPLAWRIARANQDDGVAHFLIEWFELALD